MPEASRIECPHCATRLKVKDPSLYGKKIRCPKCAEPFVAKTPAAAEDHFLGNLESLGDDFGDLLPTAKLPALPTRSKGLGKSSAKPSGEKGEEPRPKKRAKPQAAGNTLPWITWPLFGFGGGLVAAGLSVAVGYFFHREVGYIAWAVGLFVGLGVRMGAGDRAGLGAGLMAIAISICMILTGKFAVAYLVTVKFVNNVAIAADADEDTVKLSLAMEIAEEDAQKEAKAGAKPSTEDFSEVESFKELPKELREKTDARWKQLSAQQKKAFQGKMHDVQQVPAIFVAMIAFIASFRALDVLWFGLASFTAFRVASGATGG